MERDGKKSTIQVNWKSIDYTTFKLNMDGPVKNISTLGRLKGIINNHQGLWKVVYIEYSPPPTNPIRVDL